jgi:ATP-dependent helicase HrpA
LVPPLVETIGLILRKRQELLVDRKSLSGMVEELATILPPRFLLEIPIERLHQLPRYLRALQIRAERAALNPPKDREKARRLEPYVRAVRELRTTPPSGPDGRAAAERFRWLVEEFKVSVHAQELGTTEPVSAKRLDTLLEEIRGAD